VLDERLNAGRLLGRSVAMSLADIILADRYFYADYNYKAYEVPLQEKANITTLLEVVWL
jgi:hypothetical protein